jgi:hypothetical protein
MGEENDIVDATDADIDEEDDDDNEDGTDDSGDFVHLRLRLSKAQFAEYVKFRDKRGLSNQTAFDVIWGYYNDNEDIATTCKKKEAVKEKVLKEYQETKNKLDALSSIRNLFIEYINSKPLKNGVGYIGMKSDEVVEIREEKEKFLELVKETQLDYFYDKMTLLKKMNLVNVSLVWKKVINKFYDEVLPNENTPTGTI